jgi:heme/copper-type cytochrome/quinol oxidase subunit 2
MNRKRTIKIALTATGIITSLFSMSLPALAQCAMCKTAVTNSPEAARLSESLNFAIIILLIPPVLIFCGMFVLAYRYRRARGVETGPPSSTHDDKEQRNWFTNSISRRKRKTQNEREAGGATI